MRRRSGKPLKNSPKKPSRSPAKNQRGPALWMDGVALAMKGLPQKPRRYRELPVHGVPANHSFSAEESSSARQCCTSSDSLLNRGTMVAQVAIAKKFDFRIDLIIGGSTFAHGWTIEGATPPLRCRNAPSFTLRSARRVSWQCPGRMGPSNVDVRRRRCTFPCRRQAESARPRIRGRVSWELF